MRRALLVAAVAVTALTACSTDHPVTAGAPAQEPGATTTTSAPRPAVTAEPPTLDALGLSAPRCDAWFPVHAVASTYGGEPTVVGVAPPAEGSIDVLERRYEPPDTDGDGTPDGIDNETGRVLVHRGDGTVTLARPGGAVGTPGGQLSTGDLDGDGRDELLVYSGSGGRLDLHLVPGTVAPGEHDPADVGILLPWPPNALMWPVGDHDGDGVDDVLVPGDTMAVVVPGPQLLAPGPGGVLDASSLVPLRAAPEGFVGVLELAPGVAPVFVTATDVGGDPATRIEVRVLTEPALRLRIGELAAIGGGWGSFGTASGYRSGGDRIVTYGFSGGRSGYGATWYWNLDQPCAPPASAPSPTTPPAPRPATGAATLPATG